MAQPLIGQTLSHDRIVKKLGGGVYKGEDTEVARFVQRYAALHASHA